MPRSPKNTKSTWSVQDAKNKFSAVLKAAQKTPQTVTKHGEAAAVVISAAEYERLRPAPSKRKKRSLAEHLMSIPKSDDPDFEFERIPAEMRDIDF